MVASRFLVAARLALADLLIWVVPFLVLLASGTLVRFRLRVSERSGHAGKRLMVCFAFGSHFYWWLSLDLGDLGVIQLYIKAPTPNGSRTISICFAGLFLLQGQFMRLNGRRIWW